MVTLRLRARVSTLIAAARAALPRCAGWQLTMNPERQEVVICTPMVVPGDWDLPPEYFLDLRQDVISTSRPLEDSGVGFMQRTDDSGGAGHLG